MKTTSSLTNYSSPCCNHHFSKKMHNGLMCSKCGTSITSKANSIGLKSHNYTSKLHFDIETVDRIFDQHRDTLRITNNSYMKVRHNLVNFLFDKGQTLKLSKKAIHCSCYIMDIYYEKKKESIPSKDNNMVAACCLLLGGKAVE